MLDLYPSLCAGILPNVVWLFPVTPRLELIKPKFGFLELLRRQQGSKRSDLFGSVFVFL